MWIILLKSILALVSIFAGGAIFYKYIKDNKILVFLAGSVSILSAVYLFNEVRRDIDKLVVEKKVEAKVKEIVPKKTNENSLVIDDLRYENRPFPRYNWNDAKKYCSNLNLDGYSNWRLAKQHELQKLVSKVKNKGKHGSYYIREEFVDNLEGYAWFWTNKEYTDRKENNAVWTIDFGLAQDHKSIKSTRGCVLCVSG